MDTNSKQTIAKGIKKIFQILIISVIIGAIGYPISHKYLENKKEVGYQEAIQNNFVIEIGGRGNDYLMEDPDRDAISYSLAIALISFVSIYVLMFAYNSIKWVNKYSK